MNENQSLWSTILDDIAKESTMPESTLFLLGINVFLMLIKAIWVLVRKH